MLMIPLYTMLYLFLVLADLVPLYRNRQWKSFSVYFTLLLASYALFILIFLDIRVPSPAGPIKDAVTAIFGISAS